MRAHLRVHDGSRRPAPPPGHDHACILCRRKFATAAALQAHLQTHARHIELDVGGRTSDNSAGGGIELAYCKAENRQPEDVYVALPLVQFDDFDVS